MMLSHLRISTALFLFSTCLTLPFSSSFAQSQTDLELKNKEAQVRQLKSVLDRKEDELENLSRQLSAQELLLQEKDILHAEISTMEKELKAKEKKIDAVRDNLNFQKKREDELNALLADMQLMMDEYATLKSKKLDYEDFSIKKAEMERQIEEARADTRRTLDTMRAVKEERTVLEAQLRELRDVKLAVAQEKIDAKDAEIQTLRAQLQAMEESSASSQVALSHLQEKLLQNDQTQDLSSRQQLSLEAELEQLRQQNLALKNQNKNLTGTLDKMSHAMRSAASAQTQTDPQNQPYALNQVKNKTHKDQTQSSLMPMPAQSSSAPVALAPQPLQPARYEDDGYALSEAQAMEQGIKRRIMNEDELAAQQEKDRMDQQLAEEARQQARAEEEQVLMTTQTLPDEELAPDTSKITDETLHDFVEEKIYFAPAVDVYGLVQNAEGYVPQSFGLLSNISGLDKVVYQWSEDMLFSTAEQRPIEQQEFDDLAMIYLEETQGRCTGDFAAIPVDTRDVGDMRIDSYDIACIIIGEEEGDEDLNAAASLLFFNHDGTFSAISNETASEFIETAMDKRDRLIKTLESAAFF